MTFAALFVFRDGPYRDLAADLWPADRDARRYAGDLPVVAHSPCERWGRYATLGGRAVGDDGGAFASALGSVRQYGGVLEHPADTKAWAVFGLVVPPRSGGWVRSMICGGWTCCVEQGHYGHEGRKATWLYWYSLRGEAPPPLVWGPSTARRKVEDLSRRKGALTPLPFARVLADLARRAGR